MSLRFRLWLIKISSEKEIKKTRTREKEKKEDTYKKWLLNNLTTGKVPQKVNLDALPQVYGESKTFRTLRVKFFATKAKVCKPYAR